MVIIVPVVEGPGEVNAIPVLFRNLLGHHQAYDIRVDRPIRQPRSRLVKEDTFKATVAVARKQPDCSAIVVVFDADDDCPAELGRQLLRWGAAQLGNFPLYVIVAKREYEAWLIASLETLRGKRRIRADALLPPDVESVRDAKGWLSEQMPRELPYSPTSDQAALTAIMDFRLAHRNSGSFRKLWKDLSRIVLTLKGATVELGPTGGE